MGRNYVEVKVQYCGGWGYAPKVKSFKQRVKAKGLLNRVKWEEVADKGTTGNFEITVNDQLVFSKQKTGDFPVSTKYLNTIFDAIDGELERTIDISLQDQDQSTSDKHALRVQGDVANARESDKLLPHLSELEQDEQRKSLYVSICIMLVQIPAIIGAWCWPALVLPIFGATVTGAMRSTAHSIQMVVTVIIMILIGIYVHSHIPKRDSLNGWWHKYGPFLLTCMAIPLIIADPMRHVLQDAGLWLSCQRVPGQVFPDSCLYSSEQYKCKVMCCHQESNFNCVDLGICSAAEYDGTSTCGCGCIPTTQERMWNLSPMGIFFTLVCTYAGFIFLMVGTMWNANICDKIDEIMETWHTLRNTGQTA